MASLGDVWPPRDRLGRKQLHRLALPSFLGHATIRDILLSCYEQTIPDDFWAEDVDEQGDEIAVVACPCGEEPIVYPMRSVECACGRFYLHTIKHVRVYRPEGVEAGLPETAKS